jgi:hypothetical protein
MKEILRKILFGTAAIREYSTVTIESGIRERVYLQKEHSDPKDRSGTLRDRRASYPLDVSSCHFLLCLDPIVFGIWLEKEKARVLDRQGGYSLYFRDTAFVTGRDIGKESLAVIGLDLFDTIEEEGGMGKEGGTLFLFRLKTVAISHISALKARLIFSKYYKKPGLTFDRVKAFAAAYSYPRRVRIISFREEGYYNIFPMDLLGDIPLAGRCVFGLRHTNRTLSRIIETKKIVMSEVPARYKETIYQLGSHHGSAPPPPAQLPFNVIPSGTFGFWVPEWVESYQEINVLQTINLGSHMLLWGAPAAKSTLRPPAGHLYHIHFLLYLHQLKKGTAYPLV